jgi:hypothetical protein
MKVHGHEKALEFLFKWLILEKKLKKLVNSEEFSAQ